MISFQVDLKLCAVADVLKRSLTACIVAGWLAVAITPIARSAETLQTADSESSRHERSTANVVAIGAAADSSYHGIFTLDLFPAPPSAAAAIDDNEDRIEDNVQTPAHARFEETRFRGFSKDSVASRARVYAEPTAKEVSDRVVVYITPLMESNLAQVRIYDADGRLVEVLRTGMLSAPTTYAMSARYAANQAQYVLEIVVGGRRLTRPVTLGSLPESQRVMKRAH